MPFFDDAGPRLEEERSPLWRAFIIVREQLERMMFLNLLWVIQGLPLLLAWAFPLPNFVRVLLTLYSAAAFPSATAVMFGVLHEVSQGVHVGRDLLVECFRRYAQHGLLKLMPLYSLFFWLAAFASFAAERGWLLVDAFAQLGFLLLLLISLYWGAALAAHPDWSLPQLVIHAARLVWLKPGQALILGGVCLFALLLGAISIAGMVLIIPILMMLIQTEYYRVLAPRSSR